jgi:hypothetical protein
VDADGSLEVAVTMPDSILVVASPPGLTIFSMPAVSTTTALYAKKITTVGDISYTGQALPGASQLQPVWQCFKVELSGDDTVLTWADGNINFDNVAMDLTALTYI